MSIAPILWAGAATVAGMWLARRYDIGLNVRRRNVDAQREMFGGETVDVYFEEGSEPEEAGSYRVFRLGAGDFLGWVGPSMFGWYAEYQRLTRDDTELKRGFRSQDAAANWLVRRRRFGPKARPAKPFAAG